MLISRGCSQVASGLSSLEMAKQIHTLIIFFLSLLMFFISPAKSFNFNFPNFQNAPAYINFTNGSYATPNGQIQLTANQQDTPLTLSVGRASYNRPLRLWDTATKELTSFTTRFSFSIKQPTGNIRYAGDGMTFFLAAPFSSSASAPNDSAGGCLGLSSGASDHSCNITTKESPFVAIEFDTYPNSWDPVNGSHVGIDVNSVRSAAFIASYGLENASQAPSNAQITYDSSSMNLSVFLNFSYSPVFLSHIIDLRKVLPSTVRVGFSASTGSNFEIHSILSWEFNSTLKDTETARASEPSQTSTRAPSKSNVLTRKGKNKAGLVGGVVTGVSVMSVGLGLVGFMWWKRRSIPQNDDMDSDLGDDFESGTGPRRFTYGELSHATKHFSEERKLGEGGFGGVYLGLLTNPNREIAVKKISKRSKQGKKEYVSEVKIISRLRHKNLVQLLGWCHQQGDLLLVYEFMPNGSLDFHLYGGKKKDALSWTIRYKIALNLGSALVYLHEEWEQCVLHRDIKSSNVMLDANFSAKLGDFGLARLVDHKLGSQTTVLAGTLGYLAPECAITGKASKESDVYSFGVVALEIACGRRPIEPREEPSKVRMIEWVWDLYGKGLLIEAIDRRLEGEFDVHQTEHLMIVGLWCCHPDSNLRPSISQVMKVLESSEV